MRQRRWRRVDTMKCSTLVLSFTFFLSGCLAYEISERADFGQSVVSSISSGSQEFLERFPSEATEILISHPLQFRGEFERVLFDETWGTVELGYCFSTGALILLNVPTTGELPSTLDHSAYPAGIGFARRCPDPGAAA